MKLTVWSSYLRARGGFEVDMAWKDGKLKSATIRNIHGKKCKVRYGDKSVELDIKIGQAITLDNKLQAK
jgi:alpha-L-fucosidase 2